MDSQPLTFFADLRGAENTGRSLRVSLHASAARRTAREEVPTPRMYCCSPGATSLNNLGGGEKLIIGGKSMGGRIASMVADESGARGLVCLGYPFHPPGKPAQLRVSHLKILQTPTLIAQGERDPFRWNQRSSRLSSFRPHPHLLGSRTRPFVYSSHAKVPVAPKAQNLAARWFSGSQLHFRLA